MVTRAPEYGLEFLLAFDGRIHHLEEGYWIKFEIERVKVTKGRPHGLSYSFTLHAPDGRRLVGFDNAHGVPATGGRFKRKPSETLIDDFFDEGERVLDERGIDLTVIEVEETRRSR